MNVEINIITESLHKILKNGTSHKDEEISTKTIFNFYFGKESLVVELILRHFEIEYELFL